MAITQTLVNAKELVNQQVSIIAVTAASGKSLQAGTKSNSCPLYYNEDLAFLSE